jgi:hypothetical protein
VIPKKKARRVQPRRTLRNARQRSSQDNVPHWKRPQEIGATRRADRRRVVIFQELLAIEATTQIVQPEVWS